LTRTLPLEVETTGDDTDFIETIEYYAGANVTVILIESAGGAASRLLTVPISFPCERLFHPCCYGAAQFTSFIRMCGRVARRQHFGIERVNGNRPQSHVDFGKHMTKTKEF
jgi:hypothetical protein